MYWLHCSCSTPRSAGTCIETALAEEHGLLIPSPSQSQSIIFSTVQCQGLVLSQQLQDHGDILIKT